MMLDLSKRDIYKYEELCAFLEKEGKDIKQIDILNLQKNSITLDIVNQVLKHALCGNLKELYLVNSINQTMNLVNQIPNLLGTSIHTLIISKNKITALPNLSALTQIISIAFILELDLKSNTIDSIGGVNSNYLSSLSLASNRLKKFELGHKLPNLKMIGLFGNYLGLRDSVCTQLQVQQSLCNILETLKTATPSLEHLTLDGNGFHIIKDYHLQAFSAIIALQRVDNYKR